MSATWGRKLKITLFGESHSAAIGVVVDGVPAGTAIDCDAVKAEMARRAPNGGDFSTPRKEADEFEILCGVLDGVAEGTPICAVIRNTNTKSSDYSQLKDIMRPSHADYGYRIKYAENNDVRGGGASSGRLTAPLVFAGAIAKQLLASKGIEVASHILAVGEVEDERFGVQITDAQIQALKNSILPLLDKSKEQAVKETIAAARADGDSVGGRIECAVTGVPVGFGDPLFESVESVLSSLLFSVPAVKGVEFGSGFAMTERRGSEVNDSWYFDENGDVAARTNNNGGVLGGITTGMPIVFNVAIKPTASIFKEQDTVNLATGENVKFSLKGRHDPCIVVRALPVIEAAAALAVYQFVGE